MEGMSDTTKEQMAALLQGASLASSGNDTGAKSYLQLAGIDPGSTPARWRWRGRRARSPGRAAAAKAKAAQAALPAARPAAVDLPTAS